MTSENDDWEVAVDSGEFDKRLKEFLPSTINDDDEKRNLMKSNKPIRILKRPISQSQLPVSNDTNTINQTDSSYSEEISSSKLVPNISSIPQTVNSSSLQSTKPAIKTYEQRELEYRQARLRIMGEEESSAKDNDDDDDDNTNPSTIELTSDETSKLTFSTYSTPVSYTTNAIHFTPIGPFSQQQYHGIYPSPYPSYPTSTIYMPPSSDSWYYHQQTQQYNHPQ